MNATGRPRQFPRCSRIAGICRPALIQVNTSSSPPGGAEPCDASVGDISLAALQQISSKCSHSGGNDDWFDGHQATLCRGQGSSTYAFPSGTPAGHTLHPAARGLFPTVDCRMLIKFNLVTIKSSTKVIPGMAKRREGIQRVAQIPGSPSSLRRMTSPGAR